MEKMINYEGLSSVKNIISTFLQIAEKLQRSFLYHKTELPEIEKLSSMINEQVRNELLNLSSHNKEKASQLIEIYKRLEIVHDSLTRISMAIQAKTEERVLFSDKAVKEVEALFNNLQSMLKNMVDFITTKNAVLSKHITEDQARYEISCQNFSTGHEERLIEGICMPRSSTIYLNILNNLCNISWHLVTIVSYSVEMIEQQEK